MPFAAFPGTKEGSQIGNIDVGSQTGTLVWAAGITGSDLMCYAAKLAQLYFLHSFFFLRINLLLFLIESVTEKESDIFHLLFHSPSGFDDQDWARRKAETRDFIQFSMWVQEPEYLDHFCYFLR